MSRIEFLGHAGLAVEHAGKRLLCDPWMTAAGAYNASWFQYPHYPKSDLSTLAEADAVYLSHEHEDHFDPEFLSLVDRATPILTGRVHKRRLVSRLRKLGFENIVELDDFEAYELADGFRVRIDTPTFHCPPHWFDSCALIELGELKVFNLNDCNLALPVDRIREMGIDVLFAQASPAIWYPLTYRTYDDERQTELKHARRESAIESFVGAVEVLTPSLSIPFAGPPIFFDPALAPVFVGEDSMFGTAPVAATRAAEKIGATTEVLCPGDVLELDGPIGGAADFTVHREPAYADFDYERDRRRYYDQHREEKEAIIADVLERIPQPTESLLRRFERHILPFLKGHPYFVSRIDMRVLFDVQGPGGGRWIVDFRREPDARLVYEDDGGACQYQFEIESRYLDQILRDDINWEDLFLSLRFTAHRDPDRYNQHLFTLFKMSDHRALQAIMEAELAMAEPGSVETFTLEREDGRYEVQRYCPHGGSDLKEANVVDGAIVCPGHHWRFDLETGECADAECRIEVRRIDE